MQGTRRAAVNRRGLKYLSVKKAPAGEKPAAKPSETTESPDPVPGAFFGAEVFQNTG